MKKMGTRQVPMLFCGAWALAAEPNEPELGTFEQEFENFLVTAFDAGDSLQRLEEISEGQIKVDGKTLNTDGITDEWRQDAQAFIDEYLDSQPQVQTRSAEQAINQAKGGAVSYAIEMARWSVSQGRASDLAKEAEYMFLSHYVDRNDYFWSDNNVSFLNDGAKQSDGDGKLARWLTSEDRNAYNSYLLQSTVISVGEKFATIITGAISAGQNVKDIYDAAIDVKRMKGASEAVGAWLVEADTTLEGVEVAKDIGWIADQAIQRYSEDPTLRLSALYTLFMEDENILKNYDVKERENTLKSGLSYTGSLLLAGAQGSKSVVTGAFIWAAIDFGVEFISDFFSYLSWLALRYSSSGRYAMRLNDYLFG